eukprot:COSAG02_NODE_1910_length_10418_cov_44.653552_1_plen_87_part_00
MPNPSRDTYALQLDLPSNLLAQCALGALNCRMVIEGRLTPHDIASKRTTTPCHDTQRSTADRPRPRRWQGRLWLKALAPENIRLIS